MTEPNVYASPYAIAHPDVYELVARSWQRGVPVSVELMLIDATDLPIDEDGCNCDLDAPCNNPRCVMEREMEERNMRHLYRAAPTVHASQAILDDILLDSGRDHLIRP